MEVLAETNLIIVIIVSILVFLSGIFVKRRFSYWKNKKVPCLETRFPWGNARQFVMQKRSFGETFADLYFKMKAKGEIHAGFYLFLTPQYVPIAPELIKCVLQSDFQHFVDRGVYTNERDEPLNVNLFTMDGAKWKNFRSKLSPTFTSGKMKMMFPLVVSACHELVAFLEEQPDGEAIEIKDLLARLMTDIIGTCAFGIECNSLRNPDAEFRKFGRLTFVLSTWQKITGIFAFAFPNLMRTLGVRLLRKDVHDFFMKIIKQIIAYRESSALRRNDFMHLLLQIKNKGRLDDDDGSDFLQPDHVKVISAEEVAGQAFVFFMAGFETSSTTTTFCLYELACSEEIQENLRREIVDVLRKHGGFLTYEALSEMVYMDMVINETLRKHPVVPVLNRICTRDYQVPDTDIILNAGVQVLIPIVGLHNDPDYYPNPSLFDPERFSEENKRKRPAFTYLPFGDGPRVCVGMRFGMMQIKIGLALLLKNYKFSLSPKTGRPLKIDRTVFLRSVIGGIWMNISKV